MASFETVADEYDGARPAYPAAIYDALGRLDRLRVLDIGAGTGVATRGLGERGASVIAIDRGPVVLSRAVAHTPDLPAIVADGALLPFRKGAVDLICCAQAWHWLDPSTRCLEAHRVLGEDGRWAGWWSHARGDGETWFDDYWTILESSCPGTHRSQRDVDWGAGVSSSGLFDVGDRITVGWTREIRTDDWMTDQVSHSYVAAMPEAERHRLLVALRTVLDRQFPSGTMDVPYETWLWMGRKR